MWHVHQTRHLRTSSRAFGNTDQHFSPFFWQHSPKKVRDQSTVTIIVSLIFICSVVITFFETKESILDITLYKCRRKIHLYRVFVFLYSLIGYSSIALSYHPREGFTVKINKNNESSLWFCYLDKSCLIFYTKQLGVFEKIKIQRRNPWWLIIADVRDVDESLFWWLDLGHDDIKWRVFIPFAECLQGRMADSGSGDSSGQRAPTPGGSNAGLLAGRRPTAISQGRLPSMRSRDLTLGGVKKVIGG